MWGRITRIIGLVLLAVTVASVVSPCFDLQPTTLRTNKRAITQFSLAVPFFWPATLPVSPTFLTMPRKRLSGIKPLTLWLAIAHAFVRPLFAILLVLEPEPPLRQTQDGLVRTPDTEPE